MLSIQRKISSYNYSSRNGKSIRYIVIHYTGNNTDTALANCTYFCGGNRNASAHYFVDDNSIWQCVEDNNASWHCGDGKGSRGITNANSIGIEQCCTGGVVSVLTEANTIELVKYLMKKYNIPVNKVVRHYDASGKICPNWSANNWDRWKKFKQKLGEQPTPIKDIVGDLLNKNNKNIGDSWVKALQTECNKQKFSSQQIDGIPGPKTLAGCPTLKKGAKGNITKLLQQKLGITADGIFGKNTREAVISFQRKNGLIVDGIVGKNTWKKLLGL